MSWCRSLIASTRSRKAAAWPSMYRPSAACWASDTATSGVPAACCGRPLWRPPEAGRRSVPRAPRGPPRAASPASRRSRSSSNRSTNGVGLTRTWCPGPDSSSTVSRQRMASSWKRATIAPVVTASRVNRYAVPTRTPILTPAPPGAGHRGDQGGRAGIVDAAGEDQAQRLRGDLRRDRRLQNATGLLPEHEARPRPNVPAALAPLEHEPPRSVAQILLEQSRRGDVQVRRDPLPLQLGGLVGPASGDQGPGRPGRSDRGQLLLAQAGRDESEQAHAPGPARQPVGRLFEQALDLGPRSIASATKGSPPSRATASANGATSLTRVIGPWRIGNRQPWARARGASSARGRAFEASTSPRSTGAGSPVPCPRLTRTCRPGPRPARHLDRQATPVPAPSPLPRRSPGPISRRPAWLPRAIGPGRATWAGRRHGSPGRMPARSESARCRPRRRAACGLPRPGETRAPAEWPPRGPLRSHPPRCTLRPPLGRSPPRIQTGRSVRAQDRLEENESGIRTDPPARLLAHGDQAIAPGIEPSLGLGHRCDLAQRSPAGGMDPSACIPELFRRPRVGAHAATRFSPAWSSQS